MFLLNSELKIRGAQTNNLCTVQHLLKVQMHNSVDWITSVLHHTDDAFRMDTWHQTDHVQWFWLTMTFFCHCPCFCLLQIPNDLYCISSWKNITIDAKSFRGSRNLTLGSSCSSKMVDSPKDEPKGLLFIPTDPQNLHSCLQLGKLLGGPLLILRLADLYKSTSTF